MHAWSSTVARGALLAAIFCLSISRDEVSLRVDYERGAFREGYLVVRLLHISAEYWPYSLCESTGAQVGMKSSCVCRTVSLLTLLDSAANSCFLWSCRIVVR